MEAQSALAEVGKENEYMHKTEQILIDGETTDAGPLCKVIWRKNKLLRLILLLLERAKFAEPAEEGKKSVRQQILWSESFWDLTTSPQKVLRKILVECFS